MRWLLFLFALVSAGVATAKDPPAGRTPFDLSLLPRAVGPGVIALRPAEVVEHAGTVDDTLTALITQSLKAVAAFFDGEVKAADLPALTDVEQAVFNLGPKLSITGESGESTFSFNTEKLSGYVCTREKFDWAGVVKKWFPKTTTKKHGDGEYLCVPMKVGKWEGALAFHLPDERTLVFDFDTELVEKLIDRRAKKEEVEAPAGWDEVKSATVAVVLPAGDRKWMTVGKDLDTWSAAVVDLLNDVDVACVGVTFGKETKAVAVLTANSEIGANKAAMTVGLATTGFANQVSELVGEDCTATTERDGLTVRANATVKANVLKHLAEQMSKTEK